MVLYVAIALILAALASGATIVDITGVPQTHFKPGDVIKIQFEQPGVYHVRVVDLRSGATVLEQTFYVAIPGTYVLWPTTPQTAEGTYRVYISTGQAVDITISRLYIPSALLTAAATVAALAAVYAVWKAGYLRAVMRDAAPKPALLLPNGAVLELGDWNVFGRATFLRVGVPPEVARYISRIHFAIKRIGPYYYIEDLGSKNGTYLNNVPIKGLCSQRLTHGDVINVANVLELRFLMR